MKKLKDLKKGEMFKRITKNGLSNSIFVKDTYDRETKTYCCYKYEDINSFIFIKGTKVVEEDFIGSLD